MAAIADGVLDADARDRILHHVDGCPGCRELVVAAVRTRPHAPRHLHDDGDAPAGPRPGDTVGRYRIVQTLGSGGMGVVHAAFDPHLDRIVALKVLRPDVGHTRARGAARRQQREAQAMARLRHPNVVEVYDVGTWGGRPFIAFQRIEGTDLRGWLAMRPRSWREIVDVMLQAARGLAAVHAEGLVHRDFKPDNLVVGADGVVKLIDFGLASRAGTDVPLTASGPLTESDPCATSLTADGEVLGTPAYMAPEQHCGAPVTPAADQFAFCVTLYEALYGDRPFAGRTLRDLRASVLSGRIREDRPRGVPARVHAVIERGLRTDPGERFASMHVLVQRLDAARRRDRLRWAAVATLATVAALAVVSSSSIGPSARAPIDVEPAAQPARSPAAAAALQRGHAHWAVSEMAEAREAFESAYFTAAATGDDETARAAALALVGDALARNQPHAASVWIRHAEALDDGAAGTDARLATARAEIALSRDDLPRATAELDHAGTRALPEPEVARIEHELGVARMRAGDFAAATEHFTRVLDSRIARHGALHPDVADAHADLGSALSPGFSGPARDHLQAALAVYGATVGEDDPRSAVAHIGMARLEVEAGRFEAGVDHFRRARAAAIVRHGAGDRTVAVVANDLAITELARGRFDAALAHHDEAVTIFAEHDPPIPIGLGDALAMRSTTRLHAGDTIGALADADRAWGLLAARLDPGGVKAAGAQSRLCEALLEAHVDVRAEQHCSAFVEAVEARDDGMFLDRALLLGARLDLRAGRHARAGARVRRLLAEPSPGRRQLFELRPAVALAVELRDAGRADLAGCVARRAANEYAPELEGAPASLAAHVRSLLRDAGVYARPGCDGPGAPAL